MVGVIAGILIAFTAWAWGGVVLWTQWVTAGLGLLALVFALLPSTREKWHYLTLRWLLAISIAGGMSVFVFAAVRRLIELRDLREATLQLIPNAELPALAFKDLGEAPLIIGIGTTLLLALLTGLARPSGARRRLLRFLPFWIGLFLFAWITCQSLNPWGKLIQRDLFWHIVPQDHITWLPSGLDAPFASTEQPGGMNGWRQLLIFIGPWALLCALTISIQRRRVFGWLALVACLNGLGVALAGNLARLNKWRDFLGISDPDLNSAPFGPFIYKNHAGAYLYLVAALTLALMFYLAKRRGEKADRGGPHLVVALAAFFLVLGAASTMSFAAVLSAGLLLFLIVPLAYFFDSSLRRNLSIIPALAMVALAGVVGYVGLLSADARKWRGKIEYKQRAMDRRGADDRAPLREVTWKMMESAPAERLLSGYGAGSFRWISPMYMEGMPEFSNRKGQLSRRATHAHNDWLQAAAELGLAGGILAMTIAALLIAKIRTATHQASAPKIALAGGMLLYSLHGLLDFLLFIPHLILLAICLAWMGTNNQSAKHS